MSAGDRPLIRLEAGVGQTLVIELESMPGAGVVWSPTPVPDDCTLTRSDSVPTGPGIGGPALQRFVFTCGKSGRRRLRFELKRPWESVVRAVQLVEVDVR